MEIQENTEKTFKFTIQHKDCYSRKQLLLRTLFGWLYILIPHMIILSFLAVASLLLRIVTFWVIIFTKKYPQSWFDFQVKFLRWNARFNASIWNLSDEYPGFGLDADHSELVMDISNKAELSRASVLVRALFGGIYIVIPHVICLVVRTIASEVLAFLAFWVVLFTKKYPKEWHDFNVGTLRWNFRLNAYLTYLTHDYPPFSGRE